MTIISRMNTSAAWDPEYIARILLECSRIAMKHYNAPRTSIKPDRSLVTEADHEIEAYLESELEASERGSYMIGEETIHTRTADYIDRAFAETAWIVDPIDGTVPYAHHIPTWGISIGMMVGGTLTNGAIYLPITDELFVTRGDEVLYGSIAFLNTAADSVESLKPVTANGERRKALVRASGVIALTQGITKGRGIDVPNPVQALGCAVLPLTYLLLDRYVAYAGTVKLWDCAGALPMLQRAGFVARLANGTQVHTSVDKSVYRLSPNDHKRWKFNDLLLCAATDELIEYVENAIVAA